MSNLTGTITVLGVDYDASFNPEMGNIAFSARVNGTYVTSKSWKGLAAAITAEVKKADVTVEVEFVHPDSGKRGTATKLHKGTGRPMVRWDNGGTEQVEVHSPLRPDTDVAELRRLQRAKTAAIRALDDFLTKQKLARGYKSLTQLVEDAAKAKIAEQEAAALTEGVDPVELDVAT